MELAAFRIALRAHIAQKALPQLIWLHLVARFRIRRGSGMSLTAQLAMYALPIQRRDHRSVLGITPLQAKLPIVPMFVQRDMTAH
jgi:hypothetical protein